MQELTARRVDREAIPLGTEQQPILELEEETMIKTPRRAVISLLVLLMLTFTFGSVCGAESALGTVPKPSKSYRVGVLLKTLANEWWVAYMDGCKETAKEYGVQLEFFAASTEGDVQRQLETLETMVRKGYDALMVSPITEYNLLPGLVKATKAGIPVVLVAEPISEEVRKQEGIKLETFIDADNRGAGRVAAEYMSRKLAKGSKVLIIEGMAGSPGSQMRVGGFEEAAKQLGALSIIASQAGNWDRLTAMNITMATLKVHPDLKAIYAANDTMALGAAEAVASSSAAGKVMIIGTDAIPSALDTIKEGRMAGTVDLDPGTMGRLSVESVIAALEGVKIPPYMASQVKLITRDNL